jgi:flagellar basal body-associated protein FliL
MEKKEPIDEVELRFKLVIINILLIMFLLIAVIVIYYFVHR